MRQVANAYLEAQILTAAPERLHLLVVDAAIRFGRQAEAALVDQNIEAAFFALDRCRSCVSEIFTGIKNEPNPELAERLRGLFAYVQRNLLYADLRRDPQLVRDVLGILESHRRTWGELLEHLQQEQIALRGPHTAEAGAMSWTT